MRATTIGKPLNETKKPSERVLDRKASPSPAYLNKNGQVNIKSLIKNKALNEEKSQALLNDLVNSLKPS